MPKFKKLENGIVVDTIVAPNIYWCMINPGGHWVEINDDNIENN